MRGEQAGGGNQAWGQDVLCWGVMRFKVFEDADVQIKFKQSAMAKMMMILFVCFLMLIFFNFQIN